MKRLLFCLIVMFVFAACNDVMNTPTNGDDIPNDKKDGPSIEGKTPTRKTDFAPTSDHVSIETYKRSDIY